MSDDEPVICVENLWKRFGTREILRGISFSVAKGETLVILGRSGTGKSVTLKILIGLLEASSGVAEVRGRMISKLPERERLAARKDIGYVFQGGALFDSLTILENVGFPMYQARKAEADIREQVLKRLQMVGLAHTIDQFPTELSGGMQKRAALARAIIDLPQVVFYDEPTSGLDPLTTDVINQIILRLRSSLGVTSIVVTHDIKSAFTIADRIIMLDQGRIVTSGTPSEIADSDLPWVQHFIQGRALDGEMIESGVFRSTTGRMSRSQMLSGRRIAVGSSDGDASSESGEFSRADSTESGIRQVPPAIRIATTSGRHQAVAQKPSADSSVSSKDAAAAQKPGPGTTADEDAE